MNHQLKLIFATVTAILPAIQTFAQDEPKFFQDPQLKPLPIRGYPEQRRELEDLDTPQTYSEKLGVPGRPAKTAKFYAGSPTQTKVDGELTFDMVDNGKTTATITYLYEHGQISKISVSGDSKMAGLYIVEPLKTPAGNLPMDYRQFANGTPIVLFGGYRKVTNKKEIEEAQKKMGELLLSKAKELPFEEAYKLSASKDANIRGASLSNPMQRWNSAVFMTSAFDPAETEKNRDANDVTKLLGKVDDLNKKKAALEAVMGTESAKSKSEAERKGELVPVNKREAGERIDFLR